jgi:hypothetical protein
LRSRIILIRLFFVSLTPTYKEDVFVNRADLDREAALKTLTEAPPRKERKAVDMEDNPGYGSVCKKTSCKDYLCSVR